MESFPFVIHFVSFRKFLWQGEGGKCERILDGSFVTQNDRQSFSVSIRKLGLRDISLLVDFRMHWRALKWRLNIWMGTRCLCPGRKSPGRELGSGRREKECQIMRITTCMEHCTLLLMWNFQSRTLRRKKKKVSWINPFSICPSSSNQLVFSFSCQRFARSSNRRPSIGCTMAWGFKNES